MRTLTRRQLLQGFAVSALLDARVSHAYRRLRFGGGFSGATIIVADSNGDDSTGTGSILNPYKTIARGMQDLSAGNRVFVRQGTYAPNGGGAAGGLQSFPGGTSWANAPIIQAYPGEVVTFRPSNCTFAMHFDSTPERYIIISGFNPADPTARNFKIDAVNASQTVVKITNGGGGQSAFIRFQNCEVMNAHQVDADGSGFLITDGADGCELLTNDIHDNGGTDGLQHGIYMSAANALMVGNRIWNHYGSAVQIYRASGGATASNNSFIGNLCYSNGLDGVRGTILVSSGDGNLIYNNVVRLPGAACLYLIPGQGLSNTLAYYNTLYGIGSHYGARIDASVLSTLLRNNVMNNNGTNYSNGAGGATTEDHNHYSATSPQFVDGPNGNFHLGSGSPLRGAGVAIGGITTDFDGVARPGTPDIGAFQFV